MVFNFALRLFFLLCLCCGVAHAASPGPSGSAVCPAGWTCVVPTGTIADETNVQNALTNNRRVMLLPGTFDICSKMMVSNNTDISGITWHDDDSISAAVNIAFGSTIITCLDGSFSRFSNEDAFFVASNAQNISIKNINFYGMNYYGLTSPHVNCVRFVSTGGGAVAGGSVIAYNSFNKCWKGVSMDATAGGLVQIIQIVHNQFYTNVAPGFWCGACSDIWVDENHFGDNGYAANWGGIGADLLIAGGCCGQLNNNRFEFRGMGIEVTGGGGASGSLTISGNVFDKVNSCFGVLSNASPNIIQSITFSGNRCELDGSGSNLIAVYFDGFTGGRVSNIISSGNELYAGCATCSWYHFGPLIYDNIVTQDTGKIFSRASIYDNAISMRVGSGFNVWNQNNIISNMISGAFVTDPSTNVLNLSNTVSTGIASEAFASGPVQATEGYTAGPAELITEDTSNGGHNIATAAAFGGGMGTSNIPFVFDALIQAGSTSRNIRFLYNDTVVTNQVGIIFNPTLCTYVGSSGVSGTGAVVSTPTATAVNGGTWCHVRGTITLGASSVATGVNNEIDLVTAPSTISYTGTTGSIVLLNPTFKPCFAASGTAC